MINPYLITEPTSLNVSGGRTSGFLLNNVLIANNGLPAMAKAVFANTGKEDEETLIFVKALSDNFGVDITWLEFRDSESKFEIVDFDTASRDGEPFEALIKKRGFLPNPVARFCTVELKVRTIHRYLKSIGWTEWQSMLGLRADEPRRIAKLSNQDYGKHEEKIAPLNVAGVTAKDVGDFWRSQSFDLGLPNIGGKTMHGNCDLCFLKGGNQIASLITEKPARAIWWARMESLALASKPDGGKFRKDRPSYQQMMNYSSDQQPLFSDESIECYCGD